MSLRVTFNRAMIEYLLNAHRRVGQIKLMVEYQPPATRRVSAIKVMVDYDPNPPAPVTRFYGPRTQDS